ncbi:DUF4258 domain-containing protein [Chitinophaga sp. GbtcB8]|uniref:DUF4258 domain-containing protein n=1 Tax=Chitinophaga sp. GbtcB8 TaxID=2824753 RepID=UPI001C2FB087|nr:DUF4258 domain-containing protein [Chitinophaga sp. GbtcB8]
MKPGALHKYFPVLLLAILLVIAWRWQWWRSPQKSSTEGPPIPEMVDDVPEFDRTARLEYTVHARCRMECRHVTEKEVQEIMAQGRIDLAKSNLHDHPCPTYALEGYSHEGQHLRIVFAPCDDATRVVTCIDLDKHWVCNCD